MVLFFDFFNCVLTIYLTFHSFLMLSSYTIINVTLKGNILRFVFHHHKYLKIKLLKNCDNQLLLCIFFFREVLLRQCWSSTPTERPKAAAIVEILARDPELITPCLDVPAASVELDTSTVDINMIDRARGHSFSSVWQTRKNANLLDPSHLGIFDTNHILQAGLETVQSTKHSGFKHPNKKSLHESFKRAKRDLNKERNFLPQMTYL